MSPPPIHFFYALLCPNHPSFYCVHNDCFRAKNYLRRHCEAYAKLVSKETSLGALLTSATELKIIKS